jgi:hypothetical protein
MAGKYASLREYARQYLELANSPAQAEKRRLWREHNGLNFERPLIYVRAIPYHEFFDDHLIKCEDPFLRAYEYQLATSVLFRARLQDDFVFEPYVTVRAEVESIEDRWGVPCDLGEKPRQGGAARYHPVLLEEADIEKLRSRPHQVNEGVTTRRAERLNEAVGDILPIYVDRRGALSQMWNMDISTDLAKLRGLEQLMFDVYDRPQWLKEVAGRMRDMILRNIDETERMGDFSLADHQNQAMPYALELEDPDPQVRGVSTKRLWGFLAAQETTTFSPAHFEEFMLEFQLPILERFGLTAYGCCEDLTRKIALLRRIRNLRRVAVSPFANLKACAEQIGGDYILSYRPDPSATFATGLDEESVRRRLKEDFHILRANGCKFDVTMKDVETIAGRPDDMVRWVRIVREMS